MRSLLGSITVAVVCAAWLGTAGSACAQETPSARATRKKLEKKISVDFKDQRLKDAFEEIKAEFDNRLGVKIDNQSGISNNSKVTYKADDQPLKKILNDLCDKYDMGWYVASDAKDRYDGWIIIRKSNERGHEKGKGPKGAARAKPPTDRARREAVSGPVTLAALLAGTSGPAAAALEQRRRG
jgi:hypothetical protein